MEATLGPMDPLEVGQHMVQNGTLLPPHGLQGMAANAVTPMQPLQMQSAEQTPILHRQ